MLFFQQNNINTGRLAKEPVRTYLERRLRAAFARLPSFAQTRGASPLQDLPIASPPTFVQDSVGRLVSRQGLLAEVLVRLCQALHLREARVERHGRVAGVLGHVQVSRPSQLLLDHKRLFQQLQKERKEQIKELNPCKRVIRSTCNNHQLLGEIQSTDIVSQ